jgi:hypothetical protein
LEEKLNQYYRSTAGKSPDHENIAKSMGQARPGLHRGQKRVALGSGGIMLGKKMGRENKKRIFFKISYFTVYIYGFCSFATHAER